MRSRHLSPRKTPDPTLATRAAADPHAPQHPLGATRHHGGRDRVDSKHSTFGNTIYRPHISFTDNVSLKVLRPTILRLRLRFDATVLDDHSRRRLATRRADSLHRSHHLHTVHHLVSRAVVSIATVPYRPAPCLPPPDRRRHHLHHSFYGATYYDATYYAATYYGTTCYGCAWPKTTCLPSRCGVGTVVMKNCACSSSRSYNRSKYSHVSTAIVSIAIVSVEPWLRSVCSYGL